MKKLSFVFVAFMLLAQMSLALNSYFFLTNTSGQGTIDDPAKAIVDKYSQGKIAISYGNNVGVCAIQCAIDPDITEIVVMKSRTQIINLNHPNMPDFNGTFFMRKWDGTMEAY